MEKRILIIDDNADICQVIREILEKVGYRVYTAGNGKEGFKIAKKKKPHMIFLDVMMPGQDGFQTLEEIKKNSDTISIPVVMLTACGDDQSKIKAASNYCEEYLIKPVSAEVILSKVDAVMGRMI